jgi:1-acyl-sn-glycerol-3-phosphate acyltransferase
MPEARVIPLNGAEPARRDMGDAAANRRSDDRAERLSEELRVEGPAGRERSGRAGESRAGDARGDDTIDLTERAARRSQERAATESRSSGRPVVEATASAPVGSGPEWAEALAALEEVSAQHEVSAPREVPPGPGEADDVRHLGPADPAEWELKLAGALAFLRRRLTGDYEVDEFGFDADLTEHVLATALRPVYERWFRVETRGMENLPDDGSALVVGNHSGTIPLDAAMTTLAIYDHHPAHRHLRMLGADLIFQMPFLAPLARKAGNTLACQADAERLLSTGQLVGVWPEGFKGIGKPYAERYKLQRFGRGGFVSSALRTGAPIIPCSVVGAEEIYPMIGNMKTLARLFGLPYLPITPTFPLLGPLGLVPLPSKWIIEFGEPVETASYGAAAADDPMTVFNLTDQVRETIQGTLYKLLMQRRSVFF